MRIIIIVLAALGILLGGAPNILANAPILVNRMETAQKGINENDGPILMERVEFNDTEFLAYATQDIREQIAAIYAVRFEDNNILDYTIILKGRNKVNYDPLITSAVYRSIADITNDQMISDESNVIVTMPHSGVIHIVNGFYPIIASHMQMPATIGR